MRAEDTVVWLMCPQDRPHWQAQWVCHLTGKRRTLSLKTGDGKEAERRARKLEDRLRDGLPATEERLSWTDFRARYMAEHAGSLRPASRRKLATVLDALEHHGRPATVRAVDEACLRRFAQGMRAGRIGKHASRAGGCAPHTVARYLGDVRAALRWALAAGLVERVPAFPAVKLPRLRPRPVAEADYARLRDAVPSDEWRALLALAWRAGLRLSEALLLRWEETRSAPWLDLARGRVWIPAAFSKGDSDDWMPVVPALRAELACLALRASGPVFDLRWPGGQRLTPQGATACLGRIAARAGVGLSMQSLRRGFACRLAASAPAAVLQRALRHKDIRTTMAHYASAPDEALEKAMREA